MYKSLFTENTVASKKTYVHAAAIVTETKLLDVIGCGIDLY